MTNDSVVLVGFGRTSGFKERYYSEMMWHYKSRSRCNNRTETNPASALSQTEVPAGRYENSPGQARNERRPGLET